MVLEMLAALAGRLVGSAVDPVNWMIAGAVGATARLRPWILFIGAIFAVARTAFVVSQSGPREPIDLAIWWLALFWLVALLVAFIARRFQRQVEEHADEDRAPR
jgi:hypothetical protein